MSVRRPWLLPLVPLYAAGATWKNRGFNRHAERAKRLRDPVISIGSVSAGGAGKTPFAIALGEALRRAGYRIDVLSRGYGRISKEALRVRADGDAAEFGDEPVLIARRLACPVYVAGERYRAGLMAETDRRTTREDRKPALHLLDDGFQHRQLARAADIVLLTLEDVQDVLLPAGNLREPLHALHRASVIVLRENEAEELRPVLKQILCGTKLPSVWTIDRRFAITEGKPTKRPVAFCGIARPENFRAALAKLDITPAETLYLSDHQRYGEALLRKLVSRANAAQADGFVTTAKDGVKLSADMRAKLGSVGPLAMVDVHVRIKDEVSRVAALIQRIEP